MKRWYKSAVGLAVSAAIYGAPVLAKGGVEATQLDLVAVDTSGQCNRTFFRSSQHFNNTIFVVPRVVPGAGPDGQRTFDIVPTPEKDKFVLNLRLFFPTSNESLKTWGASTLKRDLESCDMDQVKWAINSKLSDRQKSEQRVDTISPIPLTSVEVKIPGIADAGRIGISTAKDGSDTEDADVLDYYGKSLTAIFKITQAEKEYFENLVVSPDGLGATVRMHFAARHRDGSVTAQIDVNGIQTAFAAAVKGGAPLIAKAEVAATLKSVLDSRNISITSEAGQGDSLEKIQNLIIDKILKETSLAAESVSGGTSTTAADPGAAKVSVKLVADAIATKLSRQISYNLIAAPETATAQAEIQVKQTSVDDPNIVQVRVKSHYQDPSTGFAIKAGQSISISPVSWYIDHIKYNEVVTYLTKAKMAELELQNYFLDINLPGMTIENRSIDGKPVMAIGHYNYLTHLGNGFGIPAPSQYYWIRSEKFPDRQSGKVHRIEPTIANISSLPIAISFTKVGNRNLIPLGNLTLPNPYFSGRYDNVTGRLIITATRDLGTIEFRETEGFAKDETEFKEEELDLDTVVQVKDRPVRGRVNSGQPIVLHHDGTAITLQKVVVLNITRPEILSETETPVPASAIETPLSAPPAVLFRQGPGN